MAASTALQVLVSPFLGVVFENLGSLIQQEIGIVLGVTKELVKLSNTVSTIRDVIDDAEVKQIDDKPIYNWLRRLKDLAYEADDILDEYATEALIPGSDIAKNCTCNIQVTSPSGSSCFDFKRIMYRRSIGKRIKKLREKFDEMADERIKFHLNLIPGNVESRRKEKRETSSFLSEPQVYGREEEKEHITNLLLNEGAREDVSVCCIVGMGGLGKTTLAQMVYNDKHIENHFQLRCWVCVSDPFVLKTLLKSIIESTGGNARDLEDLDPLQRRVQGILSGTKFLLVLDDVWNEDKTKWYKLKSLLTCGGIGSSIIVTTRLESVASITSTLPIWRPKFLSDEDCWSLFKHYAFNAENEKSHPMLEEIGKQITKKCRGVPLAAKALGGLLCFKKTENEWLCVRDSALWDLPQNKEDAILPALRLSYNHLPSHLKQCFSYCSIFPKDYEMEKDYLIHLWMANGFVQPKGNMGLEDIGNEIFNELLWRSFFQDEVKDGYSDIWSCKMHDLVHDLACSITVNECKVVEVVDKDDNVFKGNTRHLSLQFGYSSLSDINIVNSFLSQSQPVLRTFLLSASIYTNQCIERLTYSNLKCLRVLDLQHFNIKTLHVSIGNLKHLRYLDLSYCRDLRSLPDESICNLRKLQVLKLNYCHNLQRLPENMRKMTNLRHLGVKYCDNLRRMPVGMGNLSCLRALDKFVVVPEVGRGITELSGLDHLTGGLIIEGLEHVRNSKDAKNANLMRKNNLRELSLVWSEENNGTNLEEEEVVASIGEGIQPHPNIKKLNLHWYKGLKFPSWMNHSCLPNLVEISLHGCRRCEHLPPLGQLPLLEILRVSGMDSVKCIGDEFYGGQGLSFFPTLKRLDISKMHNLEEWHASSSQVFPSLECLRLGGCPKLRILTLPTTLSFSLKNLELRDCDEMLMTLESSSSSSVLFSLVNVMGCLQSLKISCCHKIETLPKVLLENLPFTLTELHISWCAELVCLPEEMQNYLTSLKSFRIFGCPRLKYLPELGSRNNTALTRLRIDNCDGLKSVSDCLRHLTTLEDLVIDDSPELEFLHDDFQDLTSLRHLEIRSLPQMKCLPEGLQQVVAGTLEGLMISNCSGLTCLPEWMYKFTSLRSLSIDSCRNLKVLPEEMLHLTALKTLEIQRSHPDLHRRYTKETGEDWHKIAPHSASKYQHSVSTRWEGKHGWWWEEEDEVYLCVLFQGSLLLYVFNSLEFILGLIHWNCFLALDVILPMDLDLDLGKLFLDSVSESHEIVMLALILIFATVHSGR